MTNKSEPKMPALCACTGLTSSTEFIKLNVSLKNTGKVTIMFFHFEVMMVFIKIKHI